MGFLWGDMAGSHLIACERVCKPTPLGVLGLRLSSLTNKAFMMKVIWEVCSRPGKLWVQVLRSKYTCRSGYLHVFVKGRASSNLWKGVCSNWNQVEDNLA